MFVRYFVELPLAATTVGSVLTREPETWLPGIATRADHAGGQLLAEVGFGTRARVSRAVSIQIGRAAKLGEKVVIPIHWSSAGADGLFPHLDGDLEIASLGEERSQLAMSARYDPPLGALGRAADRAALHLVAEATLKDFLDNVAEAVLVESGAVHAHKVLG
jgi:hypothetical protein